MNFKHALTNSALSSKLQLFWERITFSRVTKFYFAFSVVHCLIQLIFQVQAFSINAQAADFLYGIIVQGQAFDPGFAVASPDDLRFCDSVPANLSTAECQVIWSLNASRNGTTSVDDSITTSYPDSSSTTSSPSTSASFSSTATVSTKTSTVATTVVRTTTTKESSPTASSASKKKGDDDDDDDEEEDDEEDDDDDDKDEAFAKIDVAKVKRDNFTQTLQAIGDFTLAAVNLTGNTNVTLKGQGWDGQILELSQRCLFTLNWPVETLDNTKREDVTFIVFQIWVLGMSIVAILNESMPHIIATLLTHVLATAWGGFQVFSTTQFHKNFARITTDGACGHNLLPNYWQARAAAEIPSVALNGVALLLSIFLSWRLIKLFGWQTFKRVGASRTINRVYMLVLSLSIAIQLSMFFIVVSIALWIDQLYNGSIGRLATSASVYKGVLITVLILLFPWLYLGWISVRRELRIPMLFFLAMSVGYLAGWGGMFASSTFRWTFVNWRFFSVIISASLFLTLVTFIVGLVCRINFGKGLSRYLNAQEPLDDENSPPAYTANAYADPEKVEFPTARGGVPTFSAAFGRGDEVPPPSQMKFGPAPAKLGPRFSNPDAEPFEPQPGDEDARSLSSVGSNGTTYGKASSGTRDSQMFIDAVTFNSTQLSRQVSASSQRSMESYKTAGSFDSMKSKRWVIE
ncbi:hypothetical protein SCHPADRAFT_863681 [Schizopora paradoxa]|uniref:Uncharacterized protein n=1 Tax=Schizopora paradoxa TaxID=27342 RepID=A0A0H2SSA8_9AGAM|nr:hypothetical protein SCHPADRAFT_863681 [Schizopora paradoxa]